MRKSSRWRVVATLSAAVAIAGAILGGVIVGQAHSEPVAGTDVPVKPPPLPWPQ
jgi:hypothetical protein